MNEKRFNVDMLDENNLNFRFLNLAMPDIEIGMNRKGKYAILKITRSYPVYSEDEIIGLSGYRKRGSAHIPATCDVKCGEISKSELQRILMKRESNTDLSRLKL